MQLEQGFDLPAAPTLAWPAFKNVALLVECLPGAALTGPVPGQPEAELPLRFDVKLGPIAAGFVGSGRVSFDDAAQAGCFEGTATDRRTNSRVKGAASFRLAPAGAGTRVSVCVDYTLTGALAQFSRAAIVRELASALTSQFAENLASRLHVPEAGAGAAADAADAAGAADAADLAPGAQVPTPAPAARAPVAPLNAWTLLKRVLVARWRALWRRA